MSFWAKVLDCLKRYTTTVFAPIVAIVVIIIAILLVAMGCKELQIGGILGKLFGKKNPAETVVEVANTIPEGRVDPEGKLISEGVPDPEGLTQAVVVPIKEPGLFSNPDFVQFTPPEATEEVTVQLPTGVKNKDVDKVVIVKPNVYVVTVKDSSGVLLPTVDNLLKKFGASS